MSGVVCIIPAKGHSRRLHGKNVKMFGDKPMLYHSIDTARATGLFDQIVVSTEDNHVANLATRRGCSVIWRPAYLADRDGTVDYGTMEVTSEAIEQLISHGFKVTHACCLYATAPLALPRDIIDGFRLLETFHHFVYSVGPDGADAGNWYWGRAHVFLDRIPLEGNSLHYRLPAERVCDINTQQDWDRALQLYQQLKGEQWTGRPTNSGPETSATPTPTGTK